MSLSTPKVLVIIVNWNKAFDTLQCLKAFYASDYENFHTIVVDNGSQDNSAKIIRDEFEHVEVIETGENLGFSAGNNIGIERGLQQGYEYILLLNNDAIVDPNMLTALVRQATDHPEGKWGNSLDQKFLV